MPRGYHKNQRKDVSRARARGGSSRRPLYHRTPWFIKYERHLYELQVTRRARDYFNVQDLTTEEQIEQDLRETYLGDEAYSHAPDAEVAKVSKASSLVVEEEDRGNDCIVELQPFQVEAQQSVEASIDQVSESKDGTESFFDADTVESFFEMGENQSMHNCSIGPSDHSYSFCNGMEDSASFSVTREAEEAADNASLTSTLWEFVSESIGRGNDEEMPGIRLTNRPVVLVEPETDTTSCVSGLPEPSVNVGLPKSCSDNRKQCAICMEEKPFLTRLMHKCKHPLACKNCLQTHYIDHSMKDISNFPLRCFWPGCNRTLRDVQIRQLARNHRDLELFYRQTSIRRQAERQARMIRREAERQRLDQLRRQENRIANFKVLQQCSECSANYPVYPAQETVFTCLNCNRLRPIDVISLEEIKSIVAAIGDYLVYCPACGTLIEKEGGCDHMICVCEAEFSFQEVHRELEKHHRKNNR